MTSGRPRSRRIGFFLAACVGLAGPGTLAAQGKSVITGVVLSGPDGFALAGARVVITDPKGRDTTLLTDRQGGFELAKLAPGRYQIRAIWQNSASAPFAIDLARNEKFEAEFTVGGEQQRLDDPTGAQRLPDLITEDSVPAAEAAIGTFEQRMKSGLGQYLTRPDIEARGSASVTDLLRSMSGIRVSCRGGRCLPYIQRAPPGCAPRFFIDDMPVDAVTAAMTRADELRGIEVYQGLAQVPGELAQDHQQARCGVIALWSRRGPPIRKPK
ncbi:MAG: carboxypeptidase regulatory-like domain-containing protein [Gemmatimonadales bacterium]